MGFFSSKPKQVFPWENITSEEQLHAIWEDGSEKPRLFFKHSTRCSISAMALSRFQEKWTGEKMYELYFIDLIANRSVSNLLETLSQITHQSPQVILVKNKEVIYTASHSEIEARAIEKLL